MAEVSAISWTHSTFNPWIGCTKVGPGCDNCYAENLDSRKRWGGVVHWGPGTPRHRTSVSNWNAPLTWNRKAQASGQPWRVFCASLADVFDNEVPDEWRRDLFDLIARTPALTWLLLTKRIGNVQKMAPWSSVFKWPNVWIGATIVNQEEWDRDREKLLGQRGVPVRFVSYEPAQGPIHWGKQLPDWIIVGGESGPKARPFPIKWARQILQQCEAPRVPVFIKQMGARPIDRNDAGFDGADDEAWPLHADGSDREIDDCPHGYVEQAQGADCRVILKDRAGADPTEWPYDLRVQEFPSTAPHPGKDGG